MEFRTGLPVHQSSRQSTPWMVRKICRSLSGLLTLPNADAEIQFRPLTYTAPIAPVGAGGIVSGEGVGGEGVDGEGVGGIGVGAVVGTAVGAAVGSKLLLLSMALPLLLLSEPLELTAPPAATGAMVTTTMELPSPLPLIREEGRLLLGPGPELPDTLLAADGVTHPTAMMKSSTGKRRRTRHATSWCISQSSTHYYSMLIQSTLFFLYFKKTAIKFENRVALIDRQVVFLTFII
jgi:hypothetical protein